MDSEASLRRQIDYVADAMTRMEAQVIDPREFGRLEGAVTSLKAELDNIKTRQSVMDGKLDEVLSRLTEARGGWKLLMAMGGAAASLGAVVTWFATHTISFGPR